MSITKQNLKYLIEAWVEKTLVEQATEEPAETPSPPVEEPVAPEPASAAPSPTTTTEENPEIDTGDTGTEAPITPEPTGSGIDIGSGGFDFGNKGEPGIKSDGPEEEMTQTTIGPEDVEIPADPVMAIVDEAIQLLGQTRQPQKILQHVKSSIQRYFPEIEDSTPVIKNLWDTEDVVLRDVAKRLLLFIKGI